MKILNLLNDKETSADLKLEAVTDLVTKIRDTYGNQGVNITPGKVQTTEGFTGIAYLSVDEKVAEATRVIRQIVTYVASVVEQNEGAVFNRVFEAEVALNPTLVNLAATVDSDY